MDVKALFDSIFGYTAAGEDDEWLECCVNLLKEHDWCVVPNRELRDYALANTDLVEPCAE